MKINMPKNAEYIIDTLNSRGYEAYIVGGCVRDSIMGIEPKDWDITTSAEPLEVKKLFSHTYDTGIKHGTVTVLLGSESYEVTTYRIDGKYTDNRHPDKVEFTSDLKEDLSRRDFTSNAIAYNDKEGFIDLFGGIEDIENKIIRGVGESKKRFEEDALRMLRALRFSAQLDFTIEESTYKAIIECRELIKNISSERIRDEIQKLLLSDYPERLSLALETGLMPLFLPEIPVLDKDTLSALKRSERSEYIRLAVLFRDIEKKECMAILKRLRFDNKTLNEVARLAQYSHLPMTEDRAFIKGLLRDLGEESLERLISLKRALNEDAELLNRCMDLYGDIIARGECFSLKQLNINGNDLKDMGIVGARVGSCLNDLLDRVIHNPLLNEKDILMEMAKGEG